MKFYFSEKDPQTITAQIIKALGGRELAKIVSFDVNPRQLIVTISKLGTSTLTFDHKEQSDGRQFKLVNEKIAFAHKVFQDEVKRKLFKVIEQAGGTVET